MKTVVILILLVGVAFLDARKFRCDYTYFKDVGGYLKLHDVPSSWHEARLRCHLEGSRLASPINPVMQAAMMSLIAQKKVTCAVYTGIHSLFSRGDMSSVEGVPLYEIPHTWADGEPDSINNEEGCLILLPDGKMADVKCTEGFPYMCFKKETKGMVINSCGTTDPEYNFDKRTEKCYKFHKFPRTWSRAYMTCQAEGGHLAIINSENEATVLKEIYAKNPIISSYGDYVTVVAHIGVHDWNEHGEWRTIHGDTLQEAGYDKFSPGEPNNASMQYCGAVYRNGMMDDMWCEKRAPFFCEKTPQYLDLCDD